MSSLTIVSAPVDIVHIVSTDDPGSAAHIVLETEDKTAHALVMEARVFGTEVEALCGWRWVPSKDPKNLPICEGCKAIYHQDGENRDDREELPDA